MIRPGAVSSFGAGRADAAVADWWARLCLAVPLRKWSAAAVVVALGLVVSGCGGSGGGGIVDESSTVEPLYPDPVIRTTGHAADPVVDWIDLHLDLIRREVLAPPYATRMVAHTALALQVAGSLADPSDEPISITDVDGTGLLRLPDPADFVPVGADETVLNPVVTGAVAAAEVTRGFVPSAAAQRSISVLEAQQVAAELGEGDHRSDPSVQLGLAVADAITGRASRDGFDGIDANPPRPAAGPGGWRPTPPDFLFALEPGWGNVAPLLVGPTECPVADPVVFDSLPGSSFHAEAMAVFDLDANLTDHQRTTAKYWDDRAGASFTPTGHWVHILGAQLDVDSSGPEPPTRASAARAYATLGVATGDAFIATWKAKYDTDVLRPITYLRDHVDPGWRPFLRTPNHPSYPSGHSVGSWAAAEVLTATIGDRAFTDTAHSDKTTWGDRSYQSFGEAAAEASESRRLGGIHYPMDSEAGDLLGQCVASLVVERISGA